MTYDELMETGWRNAHPIHRIKSLLMNGDELRIAYAEAKTFAYALQSQNRQLSSNENDLREKLLLAETRIFQLERENYQLRGKPESIAHIRSLGLGKRVAGPDVSGLPKSTRRVLLYEMFGKQCFYCDLSMEFRAARVDHQIPRSKHGSNHRSNLVLSCEPCNTAKGNRMPTQDELERADFIRTEYDRAQKNKPPQNLVYIPPPTLPEFKPTATAS